VNIHFLLDCFCFRACNSSPSCLDLGLLSTIDTKKGCYAGNEIVSRTIKALEKQSNTSAETAETPRSPIRMRLVHLLVSVKDTTDGKGIVLPLLKCGDKIYNLNGKVLGVNNSCYIFYG